MKNPEDGQQLQQNILREIALKCKNQPSTVVGIPLNYTLFSSSYARSCTYQRPSWGVDPGEPLGICTKTFANFTYPGPIIFHKKLPLSLLREHNLKGLPNCNLSRTSTFSIQSSSKHRINTFDCSATLNNTLASLISSSNVEHSTKCGFVG